MMAAFSLTNMSHMATFNHICSHMVTYGFSNFNRLITVKCGNMQYMNSDVTLGKEPYATVIAVVQG